MVKFIPEFGTHLQPTGAPPPRALLLPPLPSTELLGSRPGRSATLMRMLAALPSKLLTAHHLALAQSSPPPCPSKALPSSSLRQSRSSAATQRRSQFATAKIPPHPVSARGDSVPRVQTMFGSRRVAGTGRSEGWVGRWNPARFRARQFLVTVAFLLLTALIFEGTLIAWKFSPSLGQKLDRASLELKCRLGKHVSKQSHLAETSSTSVVSPLSHALVSLVINLGLPKAGSPTLHRFFQIKVGIDLQPTNRCPPRKPGVGICLQCLIGRFGLEAGWQWDDLMWAGRMAGAENLLRERPVIARGKCGCCLPPGAEDNRLVCQTSILMFDLNINIEV